MQQIYVSGNLIHSLLKEYEMKITNMIESDLLSKYEDVNHDILLENIEKLFLFATIWTFGGSLDESKKVDFSDILKLTFKKQMSLVPG